MTPTTVDATTDAALATHDVPRTSRIQRKPHGKPRVLLVQRILPHYRVPLFQALANSDVITLHLAYGRHRDGATLESIERPAGLDVAALRNSYLTLHGTEHAVYQRGLSRLIQSRAYDVVIAEFNPRIVSNLVAYRTARRTGTKFIWWGHGMGPAAGRITAHVRLALACAADAVIFYDDAQADRFVSLGLSHDHAFVAPNSIDTSAISALVLAPGAGIRDRILYVGRLVPEKKVDLLIRAFALAQRGFASPQRLTIVGDGPERDALQLLAGNLGVANQIDFSGQIYDPAQLAPLFNTSWISVSAGGIGLAAVHSLAYGVPLIVARGEPHGPEVSALTNGHNALSFSSGDADELATTMIALQRDGQRWLSMAHAARETAETHFGLARMTSAFERAVQFAVGTQHAAGGAHE